METTDLPGELRHESVVEARNRSEPKFDCYHVVLDVDQVPLRYRSQWKDGWEILGAHIEDDGRLRLTIIERYEDPTWKRYALVLTGAGFAYGYVELGSWLTATGRMGETANLIGVSLSVVAVAAVFAYAAVTLVQDYRGEYQAARP